jgi:hypothetical protein
LFSIKNQSLLVLLVMVLSFCNQSILCQFMFSINQHSAGDARDDALLLLSINAYNIIVFNQKSISAGAARDGALLLQSINNVSACPQSINSPLVLFVMVLPHLRSINLCPAVLRIRIRCIFCKMTAHVLN